MMLSPSTFCTGFATPRNRAASITPISSKSIHSVPIINIRLRRDGSSTSLQDTPTAISDVSSLLIANNDVVLKSIATGLGYLVGAASIILYTPIAVRVLRTKSAEGLTISTWWLKLTSYTCTDVYNIKNGFPISAFSESLVITFEAAIILGLVAFYQRRLDLQTFAFAATYFAITTWALFSPTSIGPSDEIIALAQQLSIILNVFALLPQLEQNFSRKSSGGYSPVTASLASGGCAIRLFTTFQLADGDPLLLLTYGVALALNLSLLLQIIYFATQKEGKTLSQLYLADVKSDG